MQLSSTAESISAILHATIDVAIATIAGGAVLLLLFPFTLAAAGVKSLAGVRRTKRRVNDQPMHSRM